MTDRESESYEAEMGWIADGIDCRPREILQRQIPIDSMRPATMMRRMSPTPCSRFTARLTRRTAVALVLSWFALATIAAAEPGKIIAQHDIREGFIAVTGGKVWFRIVGAGKPGLPLLALHGGPGGTSEPFEALTPLTDERPLVLYDQLGSGRSDRPKEIRLPTLFTCGEFDEATPASTAFFQSKLPGAKLKVIPNASHMTYLEQPEAYCAAVREFLREVEKR